MKYALTVAVCTYNRVDILVHCLEALREQTISTSWELIVIDNNSPDDTARLIKQFIQDNSQLTVRYVKEEKQGLSHARNRAFEEAKSEWILYLDDDAKAATGLIERALCLTKQKDFKVIGGVFYPWYHFGQPCWYKDRYASNALPQYNRLSVPPVNYVATGGIMLWDVKLLSELGGFNPDVGMKGNKIAYGEETYLQAKARDRGLEIAYDPELVIYHIVMEQKLHVDWFFKSYFAAGRDAVIGGQVKPGFPSAVLHLVIGLIVALKDLIISTPKLLASNYYLENWTIDVFRKVAKRIGTAYTALLIGRRVSKPQNN